MTSYPERSRRISIMIEYTFREKIKKIYSAQIISWIFMSYRDLDTVCVCIA